MAVSEIVCGTMIYVVTTVIQCHFCPITSTWCCYFLCRQWKTLWIRQKLLNTARTLKLNLFSVSFLNVLEKFHFQNIEHFRLHFYLIHVVFEFSSVDNHSCEFKIRIFLQISGWWICLKDAVICFGRVEDSFACFLIFCSLRDKAAQTAYATGNKV